MANYASKVLKIAEAEVGYLEKASSANLDNKTANAGSANYTKYGRDMCKITGVYGTHAAWCDCFIDWCFVQAFGQAEAERLLGGFSGYTPTSAGYFKNKGQWHTTPKVGDIIFFKNSTRICHTGIVIMVSGDKVYTIEGNTSDGVEVIPNGGAVCAKSYKLNNSSIAGYGRPAYDAEPVNSVPETNNGEYFGLDISSYQGNIDGKELAKHIDFAILRSTLKVSGKDKNFDYNYAQCAANGIPVGVYKFSYAKTVQEARDEAKTVIEAIKDKKISCGVWYDLEFSEQIALGKEGITNLALAFIDEIEKAGYKTGIYCNRNWFLNHIDTKKINRPVWMARYPSSDNGTLQEKLRPNLGEVIWQYSSKGNVPGISSKYVDLNTANVNLVELFKDKPAATPTPAPAPAEPDVANIAIKNAVTAYSLHVRRGPSTSYGHVKYLKKGDQVNISETKNGWYNIGDGWVSGKYISTSTGKITANALNIRATASSTGTILGTYKKNQVVKLLARNGKWYLTEKGWISGKYIK